MNQTETPKETYFAAANSENGFVSAFGELFSPSDRAWTKIYILKGGPGTGKSSLMRRIAAEAESRGHRTEYIACTSDPLSLDGIRIPSLALAFVDGTAPHTIDPQYPGAVEELISLGLFLDDRVLRERRDDIEALDCAYRDAQQSAFRWLHAAGILQGCAVHLAKTAFLGEKAQAAAVRLLRGCRREARPVQSCRFVSSNSAKGFFHLRTAEEAARQILYLEDRWEFPRLFTACLCAAAEQAGLSFVRYADPLLPAQSEGIFFPQTETLFLTERHRRPEDEAVKIRAERFFSREKKAEVRQKYRFADRCRRELLTGALDSLAKAGALHDETESLYRTAMDFQASDAFADRLISRLFPAH